jgi:hypothetical protein
VPEQVTASFRRAIKPGQLHIAKMALHTEAGRWIRA